MHWQKGCYCCAADLQQGGPSSSTAGRTEVVLWALQVVLGKDFEVDHVYHPSDGDAVYEDEVQGLVKSLYDGINATVFAYGEQTSKTVGFEVDVT
jgi:hypothetical protein